MLCGPFLGVLLWGAVATAEEQACQVAAEQAGVSFPVDRLSQAERCRISEVIAGHSTSGTIGPQTTPIDWQLYQFLLDHPSLAASLVRQLELGGYEISKRKQNVWWANDGEGTQGLATLALKDQAARIYYMEGYHDGMGFGRVYADAVLFMRIVPEEGERSVETVIDVYTHLDGRHWILKKLVGLVRPLIARTVTRVVSKAFSVAHELGVRIAEDPDQVARAAASLSSDEADEVRRLTSLLRGVARSKTSPPPPEPPSR